MLVVAGCVSGGQPEESRELGQFDGQATQIDIESIHLAGDSSRIRFAIPAGVWAGPIEIRSTRQVVAVTGAQGAPLRFKARGHLLRVLPPASPEVETGSKRIDIQIDFAARGAEAELDRDGLALVLMPGSETDRVDYQVDTGAGGIVRLANVIPSAVPVAATVDVLAASAPVNETSEVGDAFSAFCERTLLVRRPNVARSSSEVPVIGVSVHGAGTGAQVASSWIGGLVAVAPGREGAAIAALPMVLAELFDHERSTQGHVRSIDALIGQGIVAESSDDAWTLPRHRVLLEIMGADLYREALRRLVDDMRGQGPATWRDLLRAVEAIEVIDTSLEGEASRYVSAWLSSPGRPEVRTSWRYDDARRRVLLRVDQIHEVDGARPAAYPIRFVVRVDAGGETTTLEMSVVERRSLLELPSTVVPDSVSVDPEGALAGLVDFSSKARD